MSQRRNKNETIWPLIAAVFLLALSAGAITPFAGATLANAQSNPLPAPQTSPAAASTDISSDKPAATQSAPNSKSGNDAKPGFNSAIADLLAANPECAELSNNCQICIRIGAGDAACSLPGIACARGTWSCTKTQKSSKPAQ